MSDAPESTLVARLGEGEFTELAAAFYRRVAVDKILGSIYPRVELQAAEERLAAFLVQRFGGSARYSEARGHPRLRMRHAPFRIDQAARDRWIELMREAMKERALPLDVIAILDKYFAESATFMINHK